MKASQAHRGETANRADPRNTDKKKLMSDLQAIADRVEIEGGRENGEPGLRPQYHATYYAAYALDPDGHNVEAVDHGH
jgi:hypothetical protein